MNIKTKELNCCPKKLNNMMCYYFKRHLDGQMKDFIECCKIIKN